MSETPVSGNEGATDRMLNSLVAFMSCIGESLGDICSYSVTVGESYVPFRPDDDSECDDEEELCSQAWVRVTGVNPAYQQPSFGGADCISVLQVGLEVGVLRCFGIPEDGEAPTESEVLIAAQQAMIDMQAIYCGALACEVWEDITVGTWAPSGPLGGQYGGIWTFEVEV